MSDYTTDSLNLILTGILILLNAFFVAAEFALVKLNKSKIKTMEKDGIPFASTAMWLYKRQSMTLSTCQLGITMASLALGWIGEPALAHLIRPVIEGLGISSEATLHGIAFGIAFTLITALHIVIGEQFPKIYAIRKPVAVVSWSSMLMKFFYIFFYPFMWILERITSYLLQLVGIQSKGEHEPLLTEDEIRTSLTSAFNKGDLTQNRHQLLDAAFKFENQITRHIMLPRIEVTFFDLNKSYEENLSQAKKTLHTRFPLCSGSLDDIKGVVHIKDLIGLTKPDMTHLRKVARDPVFVPETLPIQVLLQEFRNTKQHMAFVEDEYGTVIGIVTLENVIEQLVGNLQDEFDSEQPDIVNESENKYLIDGDLAVHYINQYLNLNLEPVEAESLSGLLIEIEGPHLRQGTKIDLGHGISAEVVNLKNRRATRVRLILPEP